MSASVFVVTGPPASGKTTLARMLAERRERSVHLHADDFWQFVVGGYVEPWLSEAQTQNAVVMRAVCGAANDFASGGYAVVLDGVLGPWFLSTLTDRCSPAAFAIDYLILLPPLEDVLRKLAIRVGHGFTSETATVKMYREFERSIAGFERHVLDTGGMTPEDTLSAAEAAAAEGHLRLAA
jgi:cytidylate kinase